MLFRSAPVVKPKGGPSGPSRSKSASNVGGVSAKPSSRKPLAGEDLPTDDEDTVADEEAYDEMLLNHVNNKLGRGNEKPKRGGQADGQRSSARAAAPVQPAPTAAAPPVGQGEDKVAVHHAVKLLYAHKLAIAEMVEVSSFRCSYHVCDDCLCMSLVLCSTGDEG